MKKIAIGSDHRGLLYKQSIKKFLKTYQWIDVGTYQAERTDFPNYANKVAQLITAKEAVEGVLLCGSGNGMAIAANRHKGIYAALAFNSEIALLSRQHNNANILVIPSDFVSLEMALAMITAWQEGKFLGDRYQARIDMIDAL
jgi:ribose 5-phosphate isomerase B